MKERLVELMKEAETKVQRTLKEKISLDLTEWLGIYAEHLLDNGVIVPPCKVGQTVYKFNRYNKTIIDECRIRSILQREDGSLKISVIDLRYMNYFEILPDAIGKTIFLTREEAQAKLKEGGEG